MKYKLIKTQRVGAPKAIYQVVDESGKVISQRVSARVYVACSINGDYYFGRMDLVGKGDYASMLQRVKNFLKDPEGWFRNYARTQLAPSIREEFLAEKLDPKNLEAAIAHQKEVLEGLTIDYLE